MDAYKKQEAHGPHRSLRNQFKSINIFDKSYDYIITLIRRDTVYLLFDNWMVLICKTSSFFTQGCFRPSLVENGHVVLEKKNFKFLQYIFSLLCNYLPLENSMALYLNKLEFPSPKDALCQVRLKLVMWFWRRKWKCEKFTDRRTERWLTIGHQKSSLELSA